MTAARLRVVDSAKVDHAKKVDQGKKATAKKSAPASAPASGPRARTRASKRTARVGDLMRSPAVCCHAGDTLHHVAQLMWERDVGAVVVVDEHDEPRYMVTDRDVCIGAYTQGVSLWDSRVESLRPQPVITCSVDAGVAEVRRAMEEHGVRRIPVVDAAGALVGVIGLGDLIREAAMTAPKDRTRGLTPAQLAQTLSALYEDVAVPPGRVRAP
jgi:CBS domain-containing protein